MACGKFFGHSKVRHVFLIAIGDVRFAEYAGELQNLRMSGKLVLCDNRNFILKNFCFEYFDHSQLLCFDIFKYILLPLFGNFISFKYLFQQLTVGGVQRKRR